MKKLIYESDDFMVDFDDEDGSYIVTHFKDNHWNGAIIIKGEEVEEY